MVCRLAAAELAHGLADFALGFFIFFGLAAIPFFLSLGKRHFALGDAIAKINAQRDERKPFIVKFAFELADLFFAKKKLTSSQRSVVKWTAGKILANMKIDQPNFTFADQAIGVTEVGLAFAQGFHLGAKQHHTRFQPLKKVVIVGGGSILGYENLLDLFFLFFGWFRHGKLS
jgi:hypothetical protein